MKSAHIGRALCVGVDTTEAAGAGAEADAIAFSGIAQRQGFASSTLLLGAAATREAVQSQIREAAAVCRAGDLFLLTFSGHGGRRNTLGSGSEPSLRGVWVLYDGSLQDDEMHAALAEFRRGVRVLVVSDSCNGGVPVAWDEKPASPVAASVLVLTACQHEEYADGVGLPGHFSTVLVNAWKDGGFSGYRGFHQAVVARMPPYQKPNYYWVGGRDLRFEAQRPFTI